MNGYWSAGSVGSKSRIRKGRLATMWPCFAEAIQNIAFLTEVMVCARLHCTLLLRALSSLGGWSWTFWVLISGRTWSRFGPLYLFHVIVERGSFPMSIKKAFWNLLWIVWTERDSLVWLSTGCGRINREKSHLSRFLNLSPNRICKPQVLFRIWFPFFWCSGCSLKRLPFKYNQSFPDSPKFWCLTLLNKNCLGFLQDCQPIYIQSKVRETI